MADLKAFADHFEKVVGICRGINKYCFTFHLERYEQKMGIRYPESLWREVAEVLGCGHPVFVDGLPLVHNANEYQFVDGVLAGTSGKLRAQFGSY